MTPTTPPAETQWAIVARQFRKKRSAVWGLRITIGLILVAVFAPVVASSQPFLWQEKGGNLSLPWFANLFDTNVWEHGLDRLFNLLLVALTLWFVLRVLLLLAGRFTGGVLPVGDPQAGRFGVRVADQPPRILVSGGPGLRTLGLGLLAEERPFVTRLKPWLKKAVLVATALVAFVQLAEWGLLTSHPKVDYRDRAQALEAAGESHRAVFPVVPYSYRDQLPTQADKFRGVLDFEGGERHLLGTDIIGRDIFARILYGTRISLTIGLVAVSIYITIGTILGALAGYYGRRVDMAIMRLVEIMICIPQLFLLLTIVALFEQRSIFLIMFAIGLVGWTGVTRLVRGEFIRERHIEYVAAARSMGFRAPRIVFRHILPNAMGPVLVAATFGVASAILIESGLSFLGMGDVSVPSWGAILNHGRENEYWHLIIPPSVAIFLTVTALNLVGDGLRDALDPKLRD